MTSAPGVVVPPLTAHSHAWLDLAAAARLVSDYARTLIPGAAYAPPPGLVVSDAARLVALARRLLDDAIVFERASGASWEDLAAGLDVPVAQARKQWAPLVEQRRGDRMVAAAEALAGTRELEPDPLTVAEELDEWACRHREAVDVDDSACPITIGLARMAPVEELQHLAGLRCALELSGRLPDARPGQAAQIAAREQYLHAQLGTADGSDAASP
jgi:hypothetical protein